jgi:membrane protein insertase Oxa1/YidC/SpoIIIJ
MAPAARAAEDAGLKGEDMPAMLDTLFLQPLLAIYAFVFEEWLAWMVPGPRLIAFAVLINVVLMPVYRQMEERSRHIHERRAAVARDVLRLKRHFDGRELYFYIRAVHRQHGYRPVSELLGSGELLVQILVFATVYAYLAGADVLVGHGFGLILDLSRPDGLLGGINVMPFIMTAVNVAAVAAYSGERARRLQAFALALLFLVLLYASPSGLVVYWTANNAFSIVRSLARRHARDRQPTRLSAALDALKSQR